MIKLSTNVITSKIPKVLDDKIEENEYDKEEFEFGEHSIAKNEGNKNYTI